MRVLDERVELADSSIHVRILSRWCLSASCARMGDANSAAIALFAQSVTMASNSDGVTARAALISAIRERIIEYKEFLIR